MTRSILVAATLLAMAAPVAASDVVRHKLPNSNFPIAGAVEVPAGKTLVFVSGAVPPIADANAPKDSIQAYGDTKTQALGALGNIEKQLKAIGLTMGDVVKMQVFLVGDPAKGGKLDMAGFTAAYSQYFGTAAQPNLPARSTMQVAALVSPAFLVEIEVTAVRP
ncbi:RidA family protein [Luteibacter sp. 329MFSha]|uniref:RidA family protein n=1 Tax=Luteibacter sp. 329MFSha TaxID=1798239 RepID=UPI0008AF22F3|nr:RidA family protein [Luteibacter sp. 329MFSha]SEW17749.1 Enamine deaminase RidA, house cleaning of reactive enamine intermediates, YjgF/YER057c/UK114 family [Luteibacter sp. 329MFSha]